MLSYEYSGFFVFKIVWSPHNQVRITRTSYSHITPLWYNCLCLAPVNSSMSGNTYERNGKSFILISIILKLFCPDIVKTGSLNTNLRMELHQLVSFWKVSIFRIVCIINLFKKIQEDLLCEVRHFPSVRM